MNIKDAKKPGMPTEDWKFIQSFLKPNHIMLEWGAGGSTTYFSYFVKILYSIEHEPFWFKNVINAIEKEMRENVIMYLIPAKEPDYANYVNLVLNTDLKNIVFDVVLIDGRSRVNCAKKVLGFIRDDSLVFLHDAERLRYNEVYKYYDIIERTRTCVLMRKKNGKNK